MDFPLPLTLVLMMDAEERRAGAAAPATETSDGKAPVDGIPRSSGVFSVVAAADRIQAQASSRIA